MTNTRKPMLAGMCMAATAFCAASAFVVPAWAAPPVEDMQRLTLMAELSGDAPPSEQSDADKMAALAKPYGAWGFDTAGMDTSVKPGDNFYDYANGTAVRNTVIPGDQSSYGVWDKLIDLSELRLKTMIQDLAARPAESLSPDEAKIAAMYRSAMDSKTRNALDAAPLAPELRAIAAISTKTQMAAYMGQTKFRFGLSVVGARVSDDAKNPGYYVLSLGQSGLSLPDRDYYLKDNYADKLKAYEVYVADMLRMAAWPDAAKNAHDIVAFETEIARVSWSRVERRDRTKTYNVMKLSELRTSAPGFDWAAYFKAAGVARAKKIVVTENTAMPKIAKIFADTPLDTLKAWEAFTTIDQAAPYLSDRFYHRRFAFRSRTLYGVDEERPLWKRAVGATDDNLGEALGRAYVARYFPPESKAKMTVLVKGLLAAMKTHIENVTWMSDATKGKALEKLAKFGVKIGYPDKWRDYTRLSIRPDDLYGNIERSTAFEWNYHLSHIDKPVDRDEWNMTPQTVNAYYSATRNEIVFPAAILQAPFFDPKADMAVNYGAIGGTIGHEITHGFDDQGRHSDGDGRLTDWWTPEDAKKFEAQAKILGAQYDQFEVAPGFHVQGGLTMGENIADLGGTLLGLDAYRLSLKGAQPPVIDGFSAEQRVFLGWAQVWQSRYRLDFLKSEVATDPHSPDMIRGFAPLRNVDAWYKAFNIQPTDKMYVKPEDRVRIW